MLKGGRIPCDDTQVINLTCLHSLGSSSWFVHCLELDFVLMSCVYMCRSLILNGGGCAWWLKGWNSHSPNSAPRYPPPSIAMRHNSSGYLLKSRNGSGSGSVAEGNVSRIRGSPSTLAVVDPNSEESSARKQQGEVNLMWLHCSQWIPLFSRDESHSPRWGRNCAHGTVFISWCLFPFIPSKKPASHSSSVYLLTHYLNFCIDSLAPFQVTFCVPGLQSIHLTAWNLDIRYLALCINWNPICLYLYVVCGEIVQQNSRISAYNSFCVILV